MHTFCGCETPGGGADHLYSRQHPGPVVCPSEAGASEALSRVAGCWFDHRHAGVSLSKRCIFWEG
jgi:hypothetical protein